jgi:anaerobic selenocysteine-containing dehydrogenase
MVVCPEQDEMVAGLSREDLFTVVSEHFMTDTADFADIVLPATTQLEQRDLMFSWGHLYVTMNTPAIAPLGEAVPNTELFRRLAARMGFAEPVFTRTDEDMIRAAFDWSSPVLEGITPETLERDGWARLRLPGPDEYAPHAEGGFPTPSGKVEFLSSAAAGGNFVLPLFRQGSTEHQSGEPVDPLPHYVPPREAPGTGPFPLTLLSPKSHAYLNSSFADRPGQQRVQGGDTVVHMHPQDAAARGLADGAPVCVVNDRGRFAARLQVTDDVAPGVVVSPMGGWRKHAGGATVNTLSPSVFADLGRAPTFSDNLVEVLPAC